MMLSHLSMPCDYHKNDYEAKHHSYFLLQNSSSELRVQGGKVDTDLTLM